MRYVFVDFEMNPIDINYKKEKKICDKEIIEIGAVMLDDEFKEISCFKKLVKPRYNSRIFKNFEILTGIKTEMVIGAQYFEKVFPEFISWCGNDGYEIYAWSNADRMQIINEVKLKNIRNNQVYEYMLNHWIDFQIIFKEIISEEKITSLEKALNACGLSFHGKKHDALNDARNTSLLFIESKINDLSKIVNEVKEAICYEDKKTTLGEMINFEKLCLSCA